VENTGIKHDQYLISSVKLCCFFSLCWVLFCRKQLGIDSVLSTGSGGNTILEDLG